MPELSSSRKGDYSATPIVGVVKNYSSKTLKPSIDEVSSVFTGNTHIKIDIPSVSNQPPINASLI